MYSVLLDGFVEIKIEINILIEQANKLLHTIRIVNVIQCHTKISIIDYFLPIEQNSSLFETAFKLKSGNLLIPDEGLCSKRRILFQVVKNLFHVPSTELYLHWQRYCSRMSYIRGYTEGLFSLFYFSYRIREQ